MKLWLETVLGAIGSSSKNRFSPISTIFGFIKIDYETPPPFCPKPLFALSHGLSVRVARRRRVARFAHAS